jgi:hypothetical protein
MKQVQDVLPIKLQAIQCWERVSVKLAVQVADASSWISSRYFGINTALYLVVSPSHLSLMVTKRQTEYIVLYGMEFYSNIQMVKSYQGIPRSDTKEARELEGSFRARWCMR